jgi:hypothetical protein
MHCANATLLAFAVDLVLLFAVVAALMWATPPSEELPPQPAISTAATIAPAGDPMPSPDAWRLVRAARRSSVALRELINFMMFGPP